MPRDSENNVLEEPAHRALSITGYEVTPNDLHTCSGLKKRNTVILKFKYWNLKHNIQINSKNYQ